MRKTKRNILKIILSIILILLIALLVYSKITNQTVIAVSQSAIDITNASMQRAVNIAKDWLDKKDEDGKVILKNPSAPTLSELVDPSQIRDSGIYIRHEDLINIPSLFCSGKGVALPSTEDTKVKSGGKVATMTDQGKETAYITKNDLENGTVTVFRNSAEWSEYTSSGPNNPYEATTSRTYGRFNLVETRDCTPAEAWVLAEFDKNVPNTIARFESTNNEYHGDVSTITVKSETNLDTAFIDNVSSIARYVRSNSYEEGDLGEVPIDNDNDKKINNYGLIKWALYASGFNIGNIDIETFCQQQNFERIENVNDIKVGDIVFLDGSDEDSIVVYGAFNKVYDLSSTDKIQVKNNYEQEGSQPINRTVNQFAFKYAYRVSGVREQIKTLATTENSRVIDNNGTTIYIVGEPGEEAYVEQRNGTYYYVNVSDGYAPYTYVQHAWWKVKTVGHDATRTSIKDTGLANEAKDFEEYIKKVTGKSDVSQLERNSDGTFKIDYKVSMEPQDTSKVNVEYNNVTNKYIVGPFKVNYLRAVTKQDDPILGPRGKVSFSGISNSILIGTDAEGNELLDSDGNSILQLGRNYRFVYSNSNDPNTNFGHDTARNALDTDLDYPYPSSGEEFYIEIDYLDKLAQIKNFKFDFQYLTAGGKYEYYKGTFLEIHWTPCYNRIVRTTSASSSSTAIVGNEALIAISSRAGNSSEGGGAGTFDGATISLTEQTYTNYVKGKVTDKPLGDTLKFIGCESNDKDSIKNIKMEHTIAWSLRNKSGFNIISYDVDIENTSGTKGDAGKPKPLQPGEWTFNLKKDFSKAYMYETYNIKITYKYSYTYLSAGGAAGGAGGGPRTLTGYGEEEKNYPFEIWYTNELLPDEVTCLNYTSKIIDLDGKKIYVLGDVRPAGEQIGFKVDLYKDSEANVYWTSDYTGVLSGESVLQSTSNLLLDGNGHIGKYKVVNTGGEYSITCQTKNSDGKVIESKKFTVNVPKIAVSTKITGGSKVEGHCYLWKPGETKDIYYFNAYDECNPIPQNIPDNNKSIPVEAINSRYGCLKFVLSTGDPWAFNDWMLGYDKVEYHLIDAKDNNAKVAIRWKLAGTLDLDGDGRIDAVLVDTDGDGIYDGIDTDGDGRPDGKSRLIDTDGDGRPDAVDTDGDGSPDKNLVDSDGDGIPDSISNPEANPDEETGEDTSEGGSSEGGSSEGGSSEGGSSGGGSSGGGSSGGGSSGGGSNETPGEEIVAPGGSSSSTGESSTGEYSYCYFLRATSATVKEAQDQINASGSHEVIDVDADNGLSATVSGVPVELEMLNISVDLRTSMSGMVWIDHDEQKDKSEYGNLGIYDEGTKDEPAKENSVEIIVWKVKYELATGKEIKRDKALGWDANGKEIDFDKTRIYVDSQGKYEIPKMQVPAEEGLDGTKYVISYDVEFIYDGQTYEATEYLVPSSGEDKTTASEKLEAFKKTADETAGPAKDYTAYANSSYIVENANERQLFDSYFAEVYGDKVITEDGKTEGKSTGGTNGVYYAEYGTVRTQEEQETELDYDSEVVTGTGGAQKTKSNLITNDENGYVLPQYRFASRTSEAGLLLPYERLYHVKENYYDNYLFQTNQYKPIDEYFHQINLGLLERYHSDLGVKKDLYTANVVVNGNSNLTTYNSLMPLTEEALNLQLTPAYRQHTYKIDLYNSDYLYRSGAYSSISDEITKTVIEAIKEGTELRLFVTYKLEFINESVYTDVSVNEFVDYYDKSFTRIDEDLTVQIEDQTAADGEPTRTDKIVARAPYYRKLTTVASPSAYHYNKAEDLNESVDDDGNIRNTVVNSNGELILDKAGDKFATGEVKFKDEGEAGNYKVSSSVSLDGYNNDNRTPNEDLTLEPGEVLEVFVTYEIDREGYNIARTEQTAKDETRKDSLLGEKNNIVEISNYTTFYTEEACNRHTTTTYKAKNVSGRVDQDSAPDNIDIEKITSSSDTKMLEDDTEFAPCVTVEVREAEPRTLDGIVWEDARQDYGVSDGIYNNGEEGIKGIDVTMVEKIRVTSEDLEKIKKYAEETNPEVFNDLQNLDFLSHEFEYIWKTDSFPGFENEIKSGDNGKYEFKNFVTGTYVVRFEYGNNADEDVDMKYNGQDYKNTAYQVAADGSIRTNPDKLTVAGEEQNIPIDTTDILHLPGRATLNNEWHDLSNNDKAKLLEEDRVSDARDYEPQRLRTIAYARTITNENAEVLAAAIEQTKDVTGEEAAKHVNDEYKAILQSNKEKLVENTRMVANTAKLFIDVEKQDTIAYKKVKTEDGEEEIVKTTEAKENPDDKYEYYVKNIDFGLVERPETRINVRKEISEIELYKEDGGEVILSVRCDENGNIIKEGADNIRVDKISEIHKESLGAGQGFKYIAMESNLLNGLQVKLTYKIDVINNSEIDYLTGTLANMKNVESIYNLANKFENSDQEKLYSEEGLEGTVPFNSGKAIVYGKYLGTYYYTNKYMDKLDDINKLYGAVDENLTEYNKYGDEVIAKTTIDQLVDYIDNDLSISLDDIRYENMAWVASSDSDVENKLSEVAYQKTDDNYVKDITKLQDDKERAYISKNNDSIVKNNIYLSTNDTMEEAPKSITYTTTKVNDDKQPVMVTKDGKLEPEIESKAYNAYTTKANIAPNARDNNNPNITTQLVPEKYKEDHQNEKSSATITIVTTAQANEESVNNMNYDNLVEVAMYSNAVGRRDMQAIPGNANMIAKDNKAYLAGYVKAYDSNTKEYKFQTQTVNGVNTERDAYAARDTVTFSEPTGLSLARQQANKTIRILLASLIIAAIAVVAAIIVTAIKRNKYDDNDILKTKN